MASESQTIAFPHDSFYCSFWILNHWAMLHDECHQKYNVWIRVQLSLNVNKLPNLKQNCFDSRQTCFARVDNKIFFMFSVDSAKIGFDFSVWLNPGIFRIVYSNRRPFASIHSYLFTKLSFLYSSRFRIHVRCVKSALNLNNYHRFLVAQHFLRQSISKAT